MIKSQVIKLTAFMTCCTYYINIILLHLQASHLLKNKFERRKIIAVAHLCITTICRLVYTMSWVMTMIFLLYNRWNLAQLVLKKFFSDHWPWKLQKRHFWVLSRWCFKIEKKKLCHAKILKSAPSQNLRQKKLLKFD